MCALGICYPQYWLFDTFKVTFLGHIATFKTFYDTTKKLWVPMNVEAKDVKEWVPPHFDIRNLKFQNSFKITTMPNAQAAMSLPMTKNPMSWLWCKLSRGSTKFQQSSPSV